MIEEESNLVKHARRELELLGNGPMIDDHVLEIVKIFSEQGHSGSSAAYTINLINRLLSFEELAPLTNNPDEWYFVFDGMWQNRRNPAAFSTDGGKTYTLTTDQGDVKEIYTSVDYQTFLADQNSEGIK